MKQKPNNNRNQNFNGIRKFFKVSMKLISIILLSSLSQNTFAQMRVSITIDDVPNTSKYQKDNYEPLLLKKLDSLAIPVAIFVNEEKIYETDSVSKNFNLLDKWYSNNVVTIGNHTFSHKRYSETELDSFKIDIDDGESISKELSKYYNKNLKYFRFPYNDLGKDSVQYYAIDRYLTEKEYIITPFTIESSDWVFNYLYKYYLENGNKAEAKRIAELYIDITLEYFTFFDSVAQNQYNRHINHIYLCHDNSINADYINILVHKLKEMGYEFISLEEAMKDNIYNQQNTYYKKWGVTWIYRWMNDNSRIQAIMQQEPELTDIYKLYEEIKTIKIENK